jgi:NADH:ubiquinone oxidoreductase subunit 4 (subunit M)
MHNRPGPAVESREIDGLNLAAVAPLVAVIVALGVYPNFVVHRSEEAATASIQAAQSVGQEVAAR